MSRNRSRSSTVLVLTGLAVSASVIAWLVTKPASNLHAIAPGPHDVASGEQAVAMSPVEQPAADDGDLKPQSPAERAEMAHASVAIQPISRPANPPGTAVRTTPRIEPSAYTRQLVNGLTNLDFSHGPITREQAEQWKQTLQTLTAQGAAGVPAIREFLEQNQELNFASIGGVEQLGQSSLRSAMINALGQIGGPEATAVMLGTLQSTSLPSEIAQLAQVLDQQAPGQYRQETMNAIQEILGMASKGQLAGYDVGPLFKTLENYGDASSAAALEQLSPEWRYYATMSLAGLQGGAGVSTLVREVQDPAAGGKRDFAYQMLAQVSGQSPDAIGALLEQARANQIPDSAWRKIATGLAGDQYLLGTPPGDIAVNSVAYLGLKTYHIENGNQNFYSLPVGADAQSQRLEVINQLLGATSNPTAVSVLQNAKASLSGPK